MPDALYNIRSRAATCLDPASEIPKLDPIRQTALEQDGFIYASDGKTVLARLRGSESRVLVDSKEINPWMKYAIVAVEDRRFWEHRGVDVRGIGRALWADVRHQELVQGGSTITQQFVKNTLRRDDRTIARKLKEAALAWQLERRWSKGLMSHRTDSTKTLCS